jgi:ribosomal protein RSM22 (predicted rRNA methylase)
MQLVYRKASWEERRMNSRPRANAYMLETWDDLIQHLLERHNWTRNTEALATRLQALSVQYNEVGTASAELLPARLAFSLVRDVPKTRELMRELIRRNSTELPKGGELRILDLGAGLGASTFGLIQALGASGSYQFDATWMDSDMRAMQLGKEVAAGLDLGTSSLSVQTMQVGDSEPKLLDGRYDIVVFGQVLSEMDRALEPEARVKKHVERVQRAMKSLRKGGLLLIVEPALRDRTRHLHEVRNALVAAGAHLLAPCTHSNDCPMLLREKDWCHEDRDVNLPAFLHPLARAAHLRWEGLSYSFLAFAKDPSAPDDHGLRRLRVVSGVIDTKGKGERMLCGSSPIKGEEMQRWMLLDREENETNIEFSNSRRGDLLHFENVEKRGRVGRETKVIRNG